MAGKSQCCYEKQDMEAFNLLDHPVWVFDVRLGRIWWANQAAVELWNADSLESLQARDFSKMSDTSRRRVEESIRQIDRDGRVHDSWTFYPNGEGPVQVDLSLSNIQIGCQQECDKCEGKKAWLVEADIPRSKDDLSNTSKRAAEIMRYQPMPVGMFNAQGHAIQQNPESIHVFGGKEEYTDAEIVDLLQSNAANASRQTGYNLLDRFVDGEEGERALNSVLREDGQDYTAAEIQQYTKDGEPRWFTVQMRRTMDPVNAVPVVLYNARDVTDLVNARSMAVKYAKAKQKADQASEAKSEFVAVMAHEMRTPLHQVLGFLDLLLRPNSSDKKSNNDNLTPQQKEYLKLIEASASALMTVVNDLLDFTKLEAGKMKMECIPMDPAQVALQSLQLITLKAQQKGLAIKHNLRGETVDIPQVFGDPNRVRQVLLNFLQNALKFTSEGMIALEVQKTVNEQDNKRVELEFAVQDSGIGIDPENQRIIFNKYQQADVSTSRRFGGTGLGLAICKIIVETLKGEIGVDSVVGKGSRFWFRIPFDIVPPKTRKPPEMSTSASLGKPQKQPKMTNSASQEDLPSRPLHILVAEDNKVNQKLVVALLRRLGHSSFVVDNGQLAVDAVARHNFDLVLMDIQMPVMDGLDATRSIRSLGHRLPILGLTADFRKDQMPKYQACGMNSCLGKPIRLLDLKRHLAIEYM